MSEDIMILARDVDYSKMVNRECFIEEKLDGVPGIFRYGHPVMSRGGKPILSVPHIDALLQPFLAEDPNMELIGELYIPGKPFKYTSGIIRRGTPQENEGICLRLWDCNFGDDAPYTERRHRVLSIKLTLANPLITTSRTHGWHFPPSYREAREAVLGLFNQLCCTRAYRPEGVIIRVGDYAYKKGRSYGLMRYVEKPTIDLKVCCFEAATANKEMTFLGMPYVKGDSLDAVGKILCEYKGTVIGVGPGRMTHRERRDYYEKPEGLVGKIIKVQYKADPSYTALRQPVFIGVHQDKTCPDS